MSNNKQSSIEWFDEQLCKRMAFENIELANWYLEIFEQAKLKHREEIIDATCLNDYVNEDDREIGERYYNETFE